LTQVEVKAAMNTPVGSVTGIGQAAATAAGFPSEAMLMAEPVAETAETAPQPAVSPQLEIQLDKQSYRPGETVSVERFHVGNSGAQVREFEVKAWMSLPGVPSIPLDLDPEGTPILEVAPDAPAGMGEVNARLIDPVTGDVLIDKSQPFTIGGRGARSVMPAVVQRDQENGVVLERFGDQYILSNRGTAEATVELKVWMDTPGRAPVSVLAAGADNLLVLPAGAILTLESMSESIQLRARVLDAVSGDILAEK
jgi:hypothetical protein